MISKLCIIFASLCASSALASGPEYLKVLIQRVDQKQLYLDQGWLRLGHYHQLGYSRTFRSEITGPNFFLDADGRVSPRAELIETLRQFFLPVGKDENTHAQCRYLARRLWLDKALHL